MQRVMKLQSHAHHPHAAQQMIGMGMSDEKVMNIPTLYSCPFQL